MTHLKKLWSSLIHKQVPTSYFSETTSVPITESELPPVMEISKSAVAALPTSIDADDDGKQVWDGRPFFSGSKDKTAASVNEKLLQQHQAKIVELESKINELIDKRSGHDADLLKDLTDVELKLMKDHPGMSRQEAFLTAFPNRMEEVQWLISAGQCPDDLYSAYKKVTRMTSGDPEYDSYDHNQEVMKLLENFS